MATLMSCAATAPRVAAAARRRVSRSAPPRRRSALRRLAAGGPDDGSARGETSEEGTLSALDLVLGVSHDGDDAATTPDGPFADAGGGISSPAPVPNDAPTEGADGGSGNEKRLLVRDGRADDNERETDAVDSDGEDDDVPPGWRAWFAPRSKVYAVPNSEPRAAYVLALAHVLVFAADYALYRTGHGNGGDVFLRLAHVDDALVRGGQWLRPWTACLTDYGVAQFATALLALVTVGAETEAWLGTWSFLAVYVCSSTAGVLAVAALDANTALGAGGSYAVFGAFGAMAACSAINAEPEWNPDGVAYRSTQMLAFGTALAWIAGLPTLGAEHVVSNLGHSAAFATGAAMAYFGGAPLFVSRNLLDTKTSRREKTGRDAGRGKPRLTDALEGKKDKTYVGLGAASGLLALESVFVLVQRTLADSL